MQHQWIVNEEMISLFRRQSREDGEIKNPPLPPPTSPQWFAKLGLISFGIKTSSYVTDIGGRRSCRCRYTRHCSVHFPFLFLLSPSPLRRPSSQGVAAERMSELSGHFLHPVPSPPSFTYAPLPLPNPPDTFPQRNTHQQAIDTYSAEGREELWQWRHHTLQGGQGQ